LAKRLPIAGEEKTQQAKGAAMKEKKKVRGIFEKIPGSGIWWIRFTDAEGNYRREKIGTYGGAKDKLALRRSESLRGVKLGELRRPRAVTFGELADDAILYIKGRYARPCDDVARLNLLKENFSGAADAIKPQQIKFVLETLAKEKKWSAQTRNHHHNLISVAFRVGIENEKVEFNPARAVRRQKVDDGHVRFLTNDEEKKLREAIRSKPEWRDHEAELTLALATGLRRGSMYIGLVWENVDLEGKTPSVMVPRVKSDDPVNNPKKITIPLNADALHALAVFRSRGDGTGRIVRNAAGKTLVVNCQWFPKAVRASGIAPFRWHDCRHTFASRLRQNGVPLETIAELLGHSPKSGFAMTKRYAHLKIDNLHEAVSRITNSTTLAPATISESTETAYVN
jgi:integrase